MVIKSCGSGHPAALRAGGRGAARLVPRSLQSPMHLPSAAEQSPPTPLLGGFPSSYWPELGHTATQVQRRQEGQPLCPCPPHHATPPPPKFWPPSTPMLLNLSAEHSFETQASGGQTFPPGASRALHTLSMLRRELGTIPATCSRSESSPPLPAPALSPHPPPTCSHSESSQSLHLHEQGPGHHV